MKRERKVNRMSSMVRTIHLMGMPGSNHVRAFLLVSLLIATSACPKNAEGAEPRPVNTDSNQVRLVELRGRVVCLAEEMKAKHDTELPTRHQHLWGFRTTNGVYYTLLEGKFSQALFQDERVRAKELLLKARLLPQSHLLELTYFHSIKNGAVQNLYYYCEICAIATVSPETCACCQAPVELVEKPLTERSD